MLQVWTSRITYVGHDRLDVTRKSGGELGVLFAPSWSILSPALQKRKQKRSHEEKTLDWQEYSEQFLSEMRASYRDHREQWQQLLQRSCVTLCCYCTDAKHCHRTILAERVFPALGATYLGERR